MKCVKGIKLPCLYIVQFTLIIRTHKKKVPLESTYRALSDTTMVLLLYEHPLFCVTTKSANQNCGGWKPNKMCWTSSQMYFIDIFYTNLSQKWEIIQSRFIHLHDKHHKCFIFIFLTVFCVSCSQACYSSPDSFSSVQKPSERWELDLGSSAYDFPCFDL